MTGKIQRPKVYLRVDPALAFTHPNPGLYLKVLCFAAQQPRRGRFKDWALVTALFGDAEAAFLRDRGDLVQLPDGRWYVDQWDPWQEGDFTVGERVKRIRAKHSMNEPSSSSPGEDARFMRGANRVEPVTDPGTEPEETVTEPLPDRCLPSDALGRTDVLTESPPCPPADAGGGHRVRAPADEHGPLVVRKTSLPAAPGAPPGRQPSHRRAAETRLVQAWRAAGKPPMTPRQLRRLRQRLTGGETETEILASWQRAAEAEALEAADRQPLPAEEATAVAARCAETLERLRSPAAAAPQRAQPAPEPAPPAGDEGDGDEVQALRLLGGPLVPTSTVSVVRQP